MLRGLRVLRSFGRSRSRSRGGRRRPGRSLAIRSTGRPLIKVGDVRTYTAELVVLFLAEIRIFLLNAVGLCQTALESGRPRYVVRGLRKRFREMLQRRRVGDLPMHTLENDKHFFGSRPANR